MLSILLEQSMITFTHLVGLSYDALALCTFAAFLEPRSDHGTKEPGVAIRIAEEEWHATLTVTICGAAGACATIRLS